LSEDEVEDAFREAHIDSKGYIDIGKYVKTICGSADEE